MSDLINREDAIDVHCGLCPNQFICCPVSNGNICPDVEVFKLISSAQTERKKGHWIRHIITGLGPKLNDTIECSECRIAFSTENMFRRSFCPSCGADMRTEENDDN